MGRASLAQDLWLGFEARLRGRRLAPWEEPATRLLFQLDAGQRLDDAPVASLLESLAGRVEVIAWEPRCAGAPPGLELIEDARRIASEGGRRFGDRPVLLGGQGVSAWAALALADTPGLAGVLALAPSLRHAGPTAAGPLAPAPSPLRAALASALVAKPPALPLLVVEGRERPAPEARVVAEWVTRAPSAALLVVGGGDDALLEEPWLSVIAAWADARGRVGP
jgi:hypothetical protein